MKSHDLLIALHCTSLHSTADAFAISAPFSSLAETFLRSYFNNEQTTQHTTNLVTILGRQSAVDWLGVTGGITWYIYI